MAENPEPIIKLEEGGTASVISYNVPEPTSYTGRNFIELALTEDYFLAAAFEEPAEEEGADDEGSSTGFGKLGDVAVRHEVLTEVGIPTTRRGAGSRRRAGTGAALTRETTTTATAAPSASSAPSSPSAASGEALAMSAVKGRAQLGWYKSASGNYRLESNVPVSKSVEQLTPEQAAVATGAGQQPVVYRTLYGTYNIAYVAAPAAAEPSLLLVETYRLSSYLGNYGAGRTIKTYSLFPGEKASISVKTYKQTESEEQSASSILDSFTETSSDEFETSVATEQADTETYEKTKNYSVEAEAHASWGFGGASVSGSYSGSTQSAREEFAKNISSATEKHAATASAKREVQVETSYQVTETEGEETSIVREFQNINVSRTLNFVFRQMNQEFITLLHLVDVRVAFFNGFPEMTYEVSLPDLDLLLQEYIAESAREEVKAKIVDELSNIFDYRDNPYSFVEERQLADAAGGTFTYYRTKKDMTSQYEDAATGTSITVPGIILSAKKYVLRTDGVIVEALLGQAPALDDYSQALQNQTVRAKQLENERIAVELEKARLALEIVRNKDTEAAEIFQQVFPAAGEDGGEESEA